MLIFQLPMGERSDVCKVQQFFYIFNTRMREFACFSSGAQKGMEHKNRIRKSFLNLSLTLFKTVADTFFVQDTYSQLMNYLCSNLHRMDYSVYILLS